jgi:very-short-patch-repair endonuclease
MPPTDFFGRDVELDEEDNVTADIESILSMFRAKGVPERYLSWHYRSRHESLIAVSNVEFYDRRLVIFPSSGTNHFASGLKFRHLPDAVYDRGRTRTNKAEAKAVAQAILLHAKNNPHLSLGVVAFSVAQRDLIQVELEIMRRANTDLDAFFITAHPTEPFFVKNLENVQGDERDVIFISIGYGRNESGRIAKEFGPLNREGGERRLNVLISRAKMAMEVFCNFTAGDLELDANANHGVRALKHFLQYAESGQLDIPIETGKQADSPFELEVKQGLEDKGYVLEPQVGTAGYFIDLAVKDPDQPGRYILAIECDGASYHSARSARDRDRLRQGVLESLGWRFHRIWSTEWFRNPQSEIQKAVVAIEDARKQVNSARPIESTPDQSHPIIVRDSEGDSAPERIINYYQKAELTSWTGPQALHEVPAIILSRLIESIVKIEGPLHESNITKRLLTAFSLSRAGNRIVDNVTSAIRHGHRSGAYHFQDGFVYADSSLTAVVRNWSHLESTERKIEFVPPQEIDTALLEVIEMSFSISREGAISASLEMLGFGRATSNIAGALTERIDALIGQGKVKECDGKLLFN